jgi:hypothetical protein
VQGNIKSDTISRDALVDTTYRWQLFFFGFIQEKGLAIPHVGIEAKTID